MEIDLVYTWVDGADPELQRGLARYMGDHIHSADFRERRWRSFDELRYSLRSVATHAPWVRRIHLVTNGRRPAWLKIAGWQAFFGASRG